MLLRLKEIVMWLRMTALELFLNLISLLVFSILLTSKLEGHMNISWPLVFTPLFICDGLNAYICLIIFVRQYREYDLKEAFKRLATSLLFIGLIFTFKSLLCRNLTNGGSTYSEVFAPLFVLSQLLMIRACRMQ